jgi:hypothetical protein
MVKSSNTGLSIYLMYRVQWEIQWIREYVCEGMNWYIF